MDIEYDKEIMLEIQDITLRTMVLFSYDKLSQIIETGYANIPHTVRKRLTRYGIIGLVRARPTYTVLTSLGLKIYNSIDPREIENLP